MDEEERLFLEAEGPRRPKRARCAGICVCLSILLVVLMVPMIVFRLEVETTWRRLVADPSDFIWFPNMGSESCIRLIDIDGDGLDDVLVGLTEVTIITNRVGHNGDRVAHCQSINVELPCSGVIYGIRGYDFKVLWSFTVKQSIFEMVCDSIDVNGDGENDCLGAGRQGTLFAFDPRKGNVLWHGDLIRSRNTTWNFYNPVILPVDVDSDGVRDIVISHGGNPTIPADMHERDPGCLLVISGRTGKQIGQPFWMPDGKETYMSPVLYGKSTILFGSGGETVPGALYSISIDNLVKNEPQYLTLFKSSAKGVMVPPVIVDVNKDGIDDILVSCFDGTVELMDGRTLYPLWSRHFIGYEFYTSPAPGDFNSDGYLDFMLIINHGEWDRYNFSQAIILDGINGETIWMRNNSFGEFTSPLTFQMKKGNQGRFRDAFIYRQRGQSNSSSSSVLLHGIGLQDGEIMKEETMMFTRFISCDAFYLNDSIVHIYLTDTTQTRLIAMIYPPLKGDHHCSDYEPMERSGGALGDLNGDGRLETVDITTFITKLTSHNLNQFVTHSVLTRFTIDLKQNYPQLIANHIDQIYNRTVNSTLIAELTEIHPWPEQSVIDDDIEWVSNQTWNAYLGRFGNSHEERRL